MMKAENRNKILFVFILLATWELVIKLFNNNSLFFPAPSKIIFHLLENRHEITPHFAISLKRMMLAFVLFVPVAIGLAISTYFSSLLRACVDVFNSIVFPIPKVAIFPLLLLIAGVGDESKIIIIGLGVFFWVYTYTATGIRIINQGDLPEVIYAYKIKKADLIFKILLKGARFEIIEGVKLGIGQGLAMMVVSESVASRDGIGYFIWNGWDGFRVLDVYSGVVLISLAGIIFFHFFSFLQRRI